MNYLFKSVKVLLVLLSVLVLHAFVLGQILQHRPKKLIVQSPPKPIMISLITPKQIVLKKPPIIPIKSALPVKNSKNRFKKKSLN
jgi:hypothetical protein